MLDTIKTIFEILNEKDKIKQFWQNEILENLTLNKIAWIYSHIFIPILIVIISFYTVIGIWKEITFLEVHTIIEEKNIIKEAKGSLIIIEPTNEYEIIYTSIPQNVWTTIDNPILKFNFKARNLYLDENLLKVNFPLSGFTNKPVAFFSDQKLEKNLYLNHKLTSFDEFKPISKNVKDIILWISFALVFGFGISIKSPIFIENITDYTTRNKRT